MTPTTSLARRVFLTSTATRSASRAVQRPKYSSRRLQATVASIQPSYVTPPPPPYAPQPTTDPKDGSAFARPAYRVAERERNEWRASSEVNPTSKYQEKIDTGILRPDPHQKTIIAKLQHLHDEVRSYEQPDVPEVLHPTFFQRLINSLSETFPDTTSHHPKSLYLYGDVGTGKSMLMDLFHDTLPTNITRKRRVHFNAFMIDVHKRLHAFKLAHPHDGADPILPIARDLATEASVICFDEFQVTDIADAMILRRLLECLMKFGVVFVMTSNRHPTDLYKNGIQRSSFVPAIDLIMRDFEVVDLDSGTDYRKMPRALSNVYFNPLTHEHQVEVDKLFQALTAFDGPVERNRELVIWGRHLKVPESSDNVAKFTFMDLCGKPLSAADYIEVTKRFGTVFLLDVPKMGLGQKDLARRFITFIDACYESHTKLFVTSEVPIYQVFSDDKATKQTEKSAHIRSVMDDLGISDQQIGSTPIFTGEEEIFAFARACSRLIQMGTQEWARTAGHEDKHAMIL